MGGGGVVVYYVVFWWWGLEEGRGERVRVRVCLRNEGVAVGEYVRFRFVVRGCGSAFEATRGATVLSNG